MNRSCLATGCVGEAGRSCDLQPPTLKVRSVLVLLGKYMYIQAPVLAISGEDWQLAEVCALVCPSESVQPMDQRPVGVMGTEFDFIRNIHAHAPETAFTVTMSILGSLYVSGIVENTRISCKGKKPNRLRESSWETWRSPTLGSMEKQPSSGC